MGLIVLVTLLLSFLIWISGNICEQHGIVQWHSLGVME